MRSMLTHCFLVWSLLQPHASAPSVDSLKPLRWSLVMSTVSMDAVTTLTDLKQSGLREHVLEPITSKPVLYLAMNTALVVGVLSWSEQLRKDGHPVWSWIAVGVVSAVHGWAAWHNWRLQK